MADDLSQFFAKKAAKSKEKKKKVKVSVEDVGHVLEMKAKRQEERDREDEEEEKRAQEDATFLEKRQEDSEWLEFKDTNREMSLEELGIRDMNLTEQVEEALEEEKATPAEAPRTWNMNTEAKEQSEEMMMIPQPQPPKKEVYRPRHLLNQATQQLRGSAAPNIDDQEMFPTFAAAEKIEKLHKDIDKKKKNDGFTTVTSERESSNPWGQRSSTANAWQRPQSAASSMNADRDALFSAVKQVTTSGAPNPQPPPPQPLQPKNPNAYVLPHRRHQQQQQQQQEGRWNVSSLELIAKNFRTTDFLLRVIYVHDESGNLVGTDFLRNDFLTLWWLLFFCFWIFYKRWINVVFNLLFF